jgi:SAM-dependent methyltransferase
MKFGEKFSNHNRKKKLEYFLNYFKPTFKTSILDVGAAENEYQENANILEKNYHYPEKITVLGIDKYKKFIERYPKVRITTYDGKNKFPFHDKEFDICWSNAVLEHVGGRTTQIAFLKEIHRVANQAFITTPNRFFPFELHTKIFLLHWLPKKYFDIILNSIGKKWAAGLYMHLLSLSQLRKILNEAGINNYRIKWNWFMGFVVDFIVIF